MMVPQRTVFFFQISSYARASTCPLMKRQKADSLKIIQVKKVYKLCDISRDHFAKKFKIIDQLVASLRKEIEQ